MEKWEKLHGYDGQYFVSSLGRFKEVKNGVDEIKKLNQVRVRYKNVRIKKDGRWKTCNLHRLIAETFLPIPDKLKNESELQVNHKNLDSHDNRVENLEWETRRENMRHMMKAYGKMDNHMTYTVRVSFEKEKILAEKANQEGISIEKYLDKIIENY